MAGDLPPEWRIYTYCTYAGRVSQGRMPNITPSQLEGSPPPTEAELYGGPLGLGDQWRCVALMREFGYSYEEARSFHPGMADWFLAFREATSEFGF